MVQGRLLQNHRVSLNDKIEKSKSDINRIYNVMIFQPLKTLEENNQKRKYFSKLQTYINLDFRKWMTAEQCIIELYHILASTWCPWCAWHLKSCSWIQNNFVTFQADALKFSARKSSFDLTICAIWNLDFIPWRLQDTFSQRLNQVSDAGQHNFYLQYLNFIIDIICCLIRQSDSYPTFWLSLLFSCATLSI